MTEKYEGLAEGILERFIRYAKIDTQSEEDTGKVPSTDKQFDLARLVEKELKEIGVKEVEVDDKCYLYARIPANVDDKNIPSLCFLAHFDTSPEVSGKDVKPIVHSNYDGGEIRFPADPSLVLSPENSPPLKDCIGHDIITSDGSTLLGIDDKAGIAEIVEAVKWMMEHPEFKHGEIKICITPDEEIGAGVNNINMEKAKADIGYTIDGGAMGEIEDETFCAYSFSIAVKGINIHPGFAKGKMVNAIRVAADIISRLPKDMAPETTEGREGYIHPTSIKEGMIESCKIDGILRDFEMEGIEKEKKIIENIVEEVRKEWPGADINVEFKETYRNMKEMLDKEPRALAYAREAIIAAGIEPVTRPIRGGTDGARLSFMGMPTPNLFAGEVNLHSRTEWGSLQTMKKVSEVILNIISIYRDKK